MRILGEVKLHIGSMSKQPKSAETKHQFSLSIANRIQAIKTYRGNNSITHDEVATMKRAKEDGAEVYLIALKEPNNEVIGY